MKFFNRVALFSLALCSIGVQGGFAMGPGASSSPSAREIYDQYGITVVAGSDVDSDGFEKAAKVIKDHFDRYYSPGFLKRAGLERIAVYRQFFYNGSAVGGLAEGHQITVSAGAAAVSGDEPSVSSICKNVTRGTTEALNCRSARAAESGNFLVTLDHELFHVIDITALGAYQESSHWSTAWRDLNPPGFEYIGSGFNYISSGQSEAFITAKRRGFISGYATSSVLEDRAEMFGRFMYEPHRVKAQARHDHILGEKLKLIREMLQELCSGDSSCELPRPFRR